MLKISIIEGPRRRRIIVEGTLTQPWAAELATAWQKARADLHGRELVLLQLMSEKVKFHCGVFTKELLRGLACKSQRSVKNARDAVRDADPDG